eukprot:20183-Chlamydomonas_euryale.AAC.5
MVERGAGKGGGWEGAGRAQLVSSSIMAEDEEKGETPPRGGGGLGVYNRWATPEHGKCGPHTSVPIGNACLIQSVREIEIRWQRPRAREARYT